MARLSRTQRFAELRESLASDREQNLTTEQLSNYENKINDIEKSFSSQINIEPQIEEEIKETVVDQLADIVDNVPTVDSVVESNKEETFETPVEIEPTVDDTQELVIDQSEPSTQYDDLIEPEFIEVSNYEEPKQIDDSFEELLKTLETPVQEIQNIVDELEQETNDNQTVLEAGDEIIRQPEKVVDELVSETINEQPIFKAEEKAIDEVSDLLNIIEDVQPKKVVVLKEPVPAAIDNKDVKEILNIMDGTYVAPAIEDAVEEMVESHINVEPKKEVVNQIDISASQLYNEASSSVDTTISDIKDSSNDFLQQILDEALVFNKNEGHTTLDQIADSIVEERRNKEFENIKEIVEENEPIVDQPKTYVYEDYQEPVVEDIKEEETPVEEIPVEEISVEVATTEEMPVVEPNKAVEEESNNEDIFSKFIDNEAEIIPDVEFNNTVSMEIEKIMNEIASQSNTVTINAPIVDTADVDEYSIEKAKAAARPADIHPVKAQTATIEEPVEIKNISEIQKADTISETIPFKIEDTSNVADDDEEYDDAPNRVLNFLLTALIVALLLVLGFVVYQLISANII